MTTHDRITIGGFVSLALFMLALFAWLRDDIAGLRAEVRNNTERLSEVEIRLAEQNTRLTRIERSLADMQEDIEALQEDLNAVRERLARVEGELAAVRTWLHGAFVFGVPGGETPRPRQNAMRAPPPGAATETPPEG